MDRIVGKSLIDRAGGVGLEKLKGLARIKKNASRPLSYFHDACATRDVELDGKDVPAAQAHAALMSALAFAYATITATDEYLAK